MSPVGAAIAFALLFLTWFTLRDMGDKPARRPRRTR